MDTGAMVDAEGKTVNITRDNSLIVDGVGVFRRIERDGVIYAQFRDKNRYRSKCRGAIFIEIPLDILLAKIKLVSDVKEKGNGLNPTNPTQS